MVTAERVLETRVAKLAIVNGAPVEAEGTIAVELVGYIRGVKVAVEEMGDVETTLVASEAAKPNFEAPSSLESHCTLTPDSFPGSGRAKHRCPRGQLARVYFPSNPQCAKFPLIQATALELSATLQSESAVRVSNMAL